MSRLQRFRFVVVALALGLLAGTAQAETTVTGCIEYRDIDPSFESGFCRFGGTACSIDADCSTADDYCTGNDHSIHERDFLENTPVPDVRVELRRNLTNILAGSDTTDASGCFSITVTQTPDTLQVKARNDYVRVKGAKVVPLPTDSSISASFDIGDEYDGSATVDLGTLGIDDDRDDHRFTVERIGIGTNFELPASRALYIASTVARIARHVEDITGESLGTIHVRLGYEGTPWFNRFAIPDTIYLGPTDTAVIEHEYGHYLSKAIGDFGTIPSYILQQGRAHFYCGDQTLLDGDPGYCWAFFEGVATFFGAVTSLDEFGASPPDRDGDDVLYDEDARQTLCDNWDVEDNNTCSEGEQDGWIDTAAVESVVAQVLWDLIDASVDTVDAVGGAISDITTPARRDDGNSYGVPFEEVAEAPISNVFDVLTEEVPDYSPCGAGVDYNAPVTLEQFCRTYRDLFDSSMPFGKQPDLYIAYAYNNVTGGCADDDDAPEAVTVGSTSHPVGVWRNEPVVTMQITDGADDFSGSYFYRYECTFDAASDLGGGWDATEADLRSKSFNNVADTTCVEGDLQYLVVQSRDVAEHLGPITVYGPVRIDLTDPFINSAGGPPSGSQLFIGTFAHMSWDTGDALSGVAGVRLEFVGPTIGGITVAQVSEAAVGSMEFYLNPDFFEPSSGGYFRITVTDEAGNAVSQDLSPVEIVSPFAGPYTVSGTFTDGRVTAGDLDGDGNDDIVITGSSGAGTRIQTIGIGSSGVGQVITPGAVGGDLFLADVTLDGALDLVVAGDFGSGDEIRLYVNDGTGTLVDTGTIVHGPGAPLPALPNMVVRVVDLYNDGHPVLVYGGSRATSAPNPELISYDFVDDVLAPVDGTRFYGGDFEVGDINQDQVLDFVTLSPSGSGGGSIRWYEGSITQEGAYSWAEASGFGNLDPTVGDVDLGNWDRDGDLDLFLMYRRALPDGTVQDRAELMTWWGTAFIRDGSVNRGTIAEGDGHFAEIYNDGYQDILALGRPHDGDPGSWYASNNPEGARASGVPVPPRNELLYGTDTAWGDFDGDRDLDYFVTGVRAAGTASTVWYENLMAAYGEPNEDPPTPIDLASDFDPATNEYTLSWDRPPTSTDETSGEGFRYELRVGTAPGLGDVVSWSHPAGRSQQTAGDVFGVRVERRLTLDPVPYYWSVRTVDGGWRRSAPAAEAIATPTPVGCGGSPDDCDLDGLPDDCEDDRDGDGLPDDCDPDVDNDGVPNPFDGDPLDPTRCQDLDGDGCDDCAGGRDGHGPLPDFDTANDGPDTDGDGQCNPGDPCRLDAPDDTDGDGVCDSDDLCPGHDDSVDGDSDGVADGCDPCPLDSGDDSDLDTVCDSDDVCAGGDDRVDIDYDGTPDDCDPCPLDRLDDSDGDGICDSDDACPGSPSTTDTDGDGTPDDCDDCPLDEPDDTDGDSVCDADDVCPGLSDLDDTDGDGSPGPILLPARLLATSKTQFDWGALPGTVIRVRGEFTTSDDVSTLTPVAVRVHTGGSFTAVLVPPAGTGFWYLIRPDCALATWSTLSPTEAPGRDAALP